MSNETYQFFQCKKAYYVKRARFFQKNCILWSKYEAGTRAVTGTGTVTGQMSEPEQAV